MTYYYITMKYGIPGFVNAHTTIKIILNFIPRVIQTFLMRFLSLSDNKNESSVNDNDDDDEMVYSGHRSEINDLLE